MAAFVVIAIIAAVLLVTSVRSQAAPGWLNPDNLPATVVAAPPATDPHAWGAVTSDADQVVQDGVVLVERATSDDSVVDDSDVSLAAATSSAPTSDAGDPANVVTHHTDPGTTHHGRHRPTHHTTEGDEPSGPAPHDHGHHHGWDHGNGHGQGHHDGGDQGSDGPGHGHGHGHEDGHGHGNGHGRSR